MRDEFAKIDWLKTRFELDDTPSALEVGIGDDAAVIDFGNRGTIVTVDTQVEGVHFRRDLISCRALGYRAMVAAASDVYAMAGTPSASVIAITLPGTLVDEEFQDLIEGLAEAARKTGARVIGGNLSAGDALSITTTVFGLPLSRSVTRAHARPGDVVYVTGSLGSAALGLAILQSGRVDIAGAERFVERWRRPPCNGRAAKVIAELATAAVDISDGCLQDLRHICEASGVGARVRASALPVETGYAAACATLDIDPVELALTGGEDYELLFTAPASAEAGSVATEIGQIVDEAGVHALDDDGRTLGFGRAGFDHFS